MRVQFSVNDEELKRLESYAKEAGYPDISSYCKDEVFTLGQLVDNPPANLGVKLYKNQVELGIEVLDKDRTGANRYKKL